MSEDTVPDRTALERRYLERSDTYAALLEAFKQRLQMLFQDGTTRPTIKGRVKSFDSYYRKLLRKLREQPARGSPPPISDILGVRIICPFLEDLRAAERLLHEGMQVVAVERKGCNRSVGEFGYESTHLMVRVPRDILQKHRIAEELLCEVQVQTILQNAWSEVEHELVYKAGFSPFDEPLRRKLAALNAMLTLSDTIFQEIRDYQSSLHEQFQKRRASFSDQVQSAISAVFRENLPRGSRHQGREHGHPAWGGEHEGAGATCAPGASIDDLLVDALTAHNAMQFARAIDLYTSILDLGPPDAIRSVILVHRGMAHFAKSDYQHAFEDFSAALEHDGANCKAFYCRGIVHILRKEYALALSDFNRGIGLDPFHLDLLLGRAQVLYRLGNYPKALADCEAALRIDPGEERTKSFSALVKSHLNKKNC
jgi:putative GTP pyrophosphokinase